MAETGVTAGSEILVEDSAHQTKVFLRPQTCCGIGYGKRLNSHQSVYLRFDVPRRPENFGSGKPDKKYGCI
jgi:hypothetical protein